MVKLEIELSSEEQKIMAEHARSEGMAVHDWARHCLLERVGLAMKDTRVSTFTSDDGDVWEIPGLPADA